MMEFKEGHVYACLKRNFTLNDGVEIELMHIGGCYNAHKDTNGTVGTVCDCFYNTVPFDALEKLYTFRDLGLYATILKKYDKALTSLQKKLDINATLTICGYDMVSKQVIYQFHAIKYPKWYNGKTYEYKIQCKMTDLPFHLNNIAHKLKSHKCFEMFA